ncbi:B-block binding subunit of TFIIIC [Gossypium australe]|uniref:B-block binding subunit of TFIIIC n=1 Tax=Gossypium australe TaxID=47621 RepID=A0A5B6V660_9ROSI|nr:B-block binding subunit of TFIIIC [Gossypium australe]
MNVTWFGLIPSLCIFENKAKATWHSPWSARAVIIVLNNTHHSNLRNSDILTSHCPINLYSFLCISILCIASQHCCPTRSVWLYYSIKYSSSLTNITALPIACDHSKPSNRILVHHPVIQVLSCFHVTIICISSNHSCPRNHVASLHVVK